MFKMRQITRSGLRNHPDTVDDFFRLNARFLQRAPLPYLRSDFLASVVECAVTATALDHREANASVMKFLYDLLHCAR
jgi:transportin-3